MWGIIDRSRRLLRRIVLLACFRRRRNGIPVQRSRERSRLWSRRPFGLRACGWGWLKRRILLLRSPCGCWRSRSWLRRWICRSGNSCSCCLNFLGSCCVRAFTCCGGHSRRFNICTNGTLRVDWDSRHGELMGKEYRVCGFRRVVSLWLLWGVNCLEMRLNL